MKYKSQFTPFTYLIGWTKLNIWYYGSKYSKDAHPDLLWNPYKTSSEKVTEFIKIYGDPDVIQVRKTFRTVKETRHFESGVIKRINAVKSENWLNGNPGDGNFYNTGEKWNTDPEYRKYFKEVCNTIEHKEKLRENHKKQFSDPVKRANHKAACNDPTKAKERSDRSKKSNSDPDVRRRISESNIKTMSDPEFRKQRSEQAKAASAKRLETKRRNEEEWKARDPEGFYAHKEKLRAAQAERNRIQSQDPEYLKKVSEGLKRAYANGTRKPRTK